MFEKSTALSFSEYLARVRVEQARNLLLNPNMQVSEVAFAVGFQSVPHFNRVFKNLHGEAPGTYRQRSAMTGGCERNLSNPKMVRAKECRRSLVAGACTQPIGNCLGARAHRAKRRTATHPHGGETK